MELRQALEEREALEDGGVGGGGDLLEEGETSEAAVVLVLVGEVVEEICSWSFVGPSTTHVDRRR